MTEKPLRERIEELHLKRGLDWLGLVLKERMIGEIEPFIRKFYSSLPMDVRESFKEEWHEIRRRSG